MRRKGLRILILLVAAGLGVCWFLLRVPASESKGRAAAAHAITSRASPARVARVPERRPASSASASHDKALPRFRAQSARQHNGISPGPAARREPRLCKYRVQRWG